MNVKALLVASLLAPASAAGIPVKTPPTPQTVDNWSKFHEAWDQCGVPKKNQVGPPCRPTTHTPVTHTVVDGVNGLYNKTGIIVVTKNNKDAKVVVSTDGRSTSITFG